MNVAAWFMVLQICTCIGGAIGFAIAKQPWAAWTWFCYGCANIGFVALALGK